VGTHLELTRFLINSHFSWGLTMIWRDKDDIIGFLIYGVLWGIPLLLMLVLTFVGKVPLGLVIFYEIPAVISLFGLRPWKRMEISGDEQTRYILHGHVPDSSRTARLIWAFIPGYNIFFAWGFISNYFKK